MSSQCIVQWVPFSISFNYVNVPPTTVDFFAAAKNVNQTNIIAHYPSVQYTYYLGTIENSSQITKIKKLLLKKKIFFCSIKKKMEKWWNKMIKQPNWWKKNDKTTKIGEKIPAFVVCEKKIIFVFFFLFVSFEVNIFSMRFPLLMEIVIVFDALSIVNF